MGWNRRGRWPKGDCIAARAARARGALGGHQCNGRLWVALDDLLYRAWRLLPRFVRLWWAS